MSEEQTPTDTELTELLGAAIEHYASLPREFTGMVMTGWDIINIDAVVAELTEDTALAGVEGIRSADIGSRLLTFRAERFGFEFEISPNPPEVVGQLEPPQEGTVVLQQGESSYTVELDDLARFEFTLSSRAPFRLRYQPIRGQVVVTDWVIP